MKHHSICFIQDRPAGAWAQRPASLALALLLCLPATAGAQNWSYAGATGPASWGAASPAWAACGVGTRQSPVDLPAAAPRAGTPLALAYTPARAAVRNTGHTIQADFDGAGAITLDGIRYSLVQGHLHAASEHTVDKAHAPAEAHFVHRSDAGTLAVVGVLLQPGGANAAWTQLLAAAPATPRESAAMDIPVSVERLLPASRGHWRYTGSLTTPPCTEGVQWIVMDTPVTVAVRDLAAFTALYPRSNRPVQPMGERRFLP